MRDLWGSFAREGKAVQGWPTYEKAKQAVVKLDLGLDQSLLDVEGGYRRGQCQLLDQVGAGMPNAVWHELIGSIQPCLGKAAPAGEKN